MNFFSNKTLQKTISVLMLLVVCLMMVPQGVGAVDNTVYKVGDDYQGGKVTAVNGTTITVIRTNNRGVQSTVSYDKAYRDRFNTGQLPASTGNRAGGEGSDKAENGAGGEQPPSKDFCNFGFFEKGTYASQITTCMSYIMLSTSGYFLYFAGIAFNFILDYTLNMPKFIEQFNIIDVGWGAFRDISLVFFVFIILFIAINMIIGKEAFGSKKLLSQVIVAAILINFSLFFTKAMVDASNILALQFYTKIVQNSTDSLVAGGNQQYLNDADSGISAAFAHAMGLDQIWSAGTQGNAVDIQANAQRDLDWLNILTAGIFGSVFIMVTAVVFLAGAIMMLVRTLVLIFLMILSPLAWIGGLLPMTKELSTKWWSTLSSNLMYAPVYMMLMYVVMSMIIGRGNRTVDFLGMFTGSTVESTAVTAFTFVVLNALMIGCILVANKAGAAGAGMATKFAGGAVLGTAAFASRNTIGRAANALANRESGFGSKNSTSAAGRMVFSALSKTSKASMDLRGAKSIKNALASQKIDLGSANEGGIRKSIEDRNKAKTDFGETMGTEGQLAYGNSLHNRLVGGNKKAGGDLIKKASEKKLEDMNKHIKELMEDPDIEKYEKLRIKVRNPAEDLEFARLQGVLSAAGRQQVKWSKFIKNPVTREAAWEKTTSTPDMVLEHMKENRKELNDYIRNKGWKPPSP